MRPFKIRSSSSVRLIIAVAVVAALLAFGGWYHANQAERNRAIAIAARKYEEIKGHPPPFVSKPWSPDQIAIAKAVRNGERGGYIVTLGYQYVVMDRRDFLWRPIPFESGYTELERFRVGPDESCDYLGHHSGGEY